MKVESSGSRRTASSASFRIRAQTGSTLSSASTARGGRCAMTVSNTGFAGVLPHLPGQFVYARQKATATEGYRAILSGPLSQELEHALFEHPVTHRLHVVAPRNVERPPLRQQRRKVLRRARDVVLAADRDQHRHRQPGAILTGESLARTADAGRERPQVGFGLLRKRAEGPSLRVLHVRQR